MATVNNTTASHRIMTSVGECTIRLRSRSWYARIQRGKHRTEICLRTAQYLDAVERAQELVPNFINGTPALLNRSAPMSKHYELIFKNAKGRSKQSNIGFELTKKEWDEIVLRAGGKCELTGISFHLGKAKTGFRAPFAPSIDRINSKLGYSSHNVRLVCVAVNWALSDWGLNVFEAVAMAYAARKISQFAGAKIGHDFCATEEKSGNDVPCLIELTP